MGGVLRKCFVDGRHFVFEKGFILGKCFVDGRCFVEV